MAYRAYMITSKSQTKSLVLYEFVNTSLFGDHVKINPITET